jgi:branched-chain amino acid transport system permease protein
MDNVVQYLVDAISVGSVYALMALALALLFSVMGLLNFAFGELIMVGGYTMYFLSGSPAVVVICGTLLAVVFTSLALDRLAFRPLRAATPVTLIVSSFAASLLLQNLARMTVGPVPKGVPPSEFLEANVTIAGIQISHLNLISIAVTVGLLVAMNLVLRRTDIGVAMRAASEDFTMARLAGVKAERVMVVAAGISGLLAGAVALLLVSRTGAVTPTMGSAPLLIAFVGVVIGGMGSLVGATLGGFVLGSVTTLLAASLPDSVAPYTQSIAFGVVIAILVIRPAGLIPQAGARV